nr:MAG TPA: hypothetical protein [Caudoviricetes sp.]
MSWNRTDQVKTPEAESDRMQSEFSLIVFLFMIQCFVVKKSLKIYKPRGLL